VYKLSTHYSEYTRFFLPLAFQSAAQSFSYPLVAMVASHGAGGTLNLAGLAQANSVSFLLGTVGSGLLTTGMVLSKSKHSYRNFMRVNFCVAIAVLVLQLILNIPIFSKLVFESVLGLPESISNPSRNAFLAVIPLNFLFFLRNPSFVLLYNSKSTKIASFTTLFRILLTLILSPIFVCIDFTGVVAAVICLTIPVMVETFLAYRFSRKHYDALSLEAEPEMADQKKIFFFNLPLSIGGLFLSLSSMTMGAFIARASNPEIMMPVYYLAIGLVNPVSFAVNRIQPVVLTFPPLHPKDNRTLKFGLICGLTAGFLPLLFILPGLSTLYYVNLQNLNPEHLIYIKITALALLLQPLSIVFRTHSEGLAAHLRRPTTILAGQAVYLGSVVTISFFSLNIGITGNLIGPIAIISSNLFAALTIRYSLIWERSYKISAPKIPNEPTMQ
jgi:hypothetical protein